MTWSNPVPQITVCKDDEEADAMTAGTITNGQRIKDIVRIIVILSVCLHQWKCRPPVGIVVPLPFPINRLCLCLQTGRLWASVCIGTSQVAALSISNKCSLRLCVAFIFRLPPMCSSLSCFLVHMFLI